MTFTKVSPRHAFYTTRQLTSRLSLRPALQLRVFKDRTVLIYKSKEIKPISKTTKFLYELTEQLLLVDDIKASFHNSNLGSKKVS